jgi:2-oxoisovalerate dehydrogenase E2 component (dihydrolipoyl transacylase)
MTLLRARSSPVVRRIAEEHGVEISAVHGTGTGGRVTKRDILAYIAGHAAQHQEATPVPSAIARQPAEQAGARAPASVWPGDEVIPVSSMRRTIAEHMVRSERTAPHATVVMEVDMTGAVAWRTARKEEFRQREGIDLTYLSLVMKAVTLALRDHPRLNAVWDEERIIHRKAVNIGVAVALEDGLVVPVIRNADRLSIAGLAIAVAELAEKARSGSFAPDDLSGGTFTVNNPGTFGSLVSTPILVQPQVAILSTEAIIKRPVVVDDMIGIRSMMNLSLSIDHRALDGLAAARFLQQVKGWLEKVTDDLPLY